MPFPDQETYETYGQKFTHIEDWRRDNVNELVKQINNTIKKEKPYVKFGISPFGVWRNIKDDPTGSNTTAGMTNYDDLYADTREWIQQHHIDYITPQIYWSIGFQPAAYDVLTKWWSNEVKGNLFTCTLAKRRIKSIKTVILLGLIPRSIFARSS